MLSLQGEVDLHEHLESRAGVVVGALWKSTWWESDSSKVFMYCVATSSL
ncbi:hypothetical protein [Humibacter ginsengiterrae]